MLHQKITIEYYYTTNKNNMANTTIGNEYQYTHQLGLPRPLESVITAKDYATLNGAKNT